MSSMFAQGFRDGRDFAVSKVFGLVFYKELPRFDSATEEEAYFDGFWQSYYNIVN